MISIHTEVVDNIIQVSTATVEKCVSLILKDKGIESADITVIFGTAEMLKKLKKQFFNQNVYTDVIAFRLDNGDSIEGEIYISPEIALENSKKFNTAYHNELSRLVFHGALHLIGYNDDTTQNKLKMKRKEDRFLNQINSAEILLK